MVGHDAMGVASDEWPIGLIDQLEAAVAGNPVRRRWWWLSPRRILRDRFVAAVGWILLPVVGLAVVGVAVVLAEDRADMGRAAH